MCCGCSMMVWPLAKQPSATTQALKFQWSTPLLLGWCSLGLIPRSPIHFSPGKFIVGNFQFHIICNIYVVGVYVFICPKLCLGIHISFELTWNFLLHKARNCFARSDFSLICISLFNNLTVDIGSQRTEAADQAAVSMFNF